MVLWRLLSGERRLSVGGLIHCGQASCLFWMIGGIVALISDVIRQLSKAWLSSSKGSFFKLS
jgi:hypothetical protein